MKDQPKVEVGGYSEGGQVTNQNISGSEGGVTITLVDDISMVKLQLEPGEVLVMKVVTTISPRWWI